MIRTKRREFWLRRWQRGAIVLLAAVSAGLLGLYPSAGPANAAFPGSNGKIVFDRYLRGLGPSERRAVFTVDPKTRRLHKLIRADAREPSWSANGKKIVFIRRLHGSSGPVEDDLFTANANGRHVRRLTRTAATELFPGWSPNGRWIVFSRAAAPPAPGQPLGPPAIYKMKADGTRVTRLTAPDADISPVWSPNGRQIVFEKFGQGGGEGARIFTMKPDGSGKRLLVTNGGGPDWSPNGKQIAFTRLVNRHSKIWVMTATGTHVHLVGPKTPLNGGGPAWSPDGRQIAFVGQDRPGHEVGIFRMNADGTHVVRLTVPGEKSGDFNAKDSSPDWQPLRH